MDAGERRDRSLGEFRGADCIAACPPAFTGPCRPLPGQRLRLPQGALNGEAHGGAPVRSGEVDATGDLADSACIRKSLRSDFLERTSGPCAETVSRGFQARERPARRSRSFFASLPVSFESSAVYKGLARFLTPVPLRP